MKISISGCLFNKHLLLIAVFLLLTTQVIGQFFNSIEADFSIKEKTIDSVDKLIVGKLYYNKNLKKLLYDITFPTREKWLIQDSTVYSIIEDKIASVQKIPPINEFSFFHLLLSGSLTEYGLNVENSFMEPKSVEKDGDLVITRWETKKPIKGFSGYVLTSKKDKLLQGVIIYGENNVVVGKQFFRAYNYVGGLMIPTEIIQITYVGEQENTRILTYRNVKINNPNGKENYNFPIDDYK